MMTRESVLDKAKSVITGEREQQYGSPEDNFKIIAALWDAYLDARYDSVDTFDENGEYDGYEIDAHDVAVMMCLLKIGRIASGRTTEDNYVDLAGYAACAGEIAESEGNG
jgi:hypothetical protein